MTNPQPRAPKPKLRQREGLLTIAVSVAISFFFLGQGAAHATQIINATDGQNIIANISYRDMTRIAIEDARIKKVKAPNGELLIDFDEEVGQIFVRVANANKPVNIFIITNTGKTYALALQIKDIPAEQIILRDSTRNNQDMGSSVEKAGSHENALKTFMMLLGQNRPPLDMEVKQINQPVALWHQVSYTLEQSWHSRRLVGERYLLKNVSGAELTIAEPEFYKEGVLAIAVPTQVLAPNAETLVLIVREKGATE